MEGCIGRRVQSGTRLTPAEESVELHDSQDKHASLAFRVGGGVGGGCLLGLNRMQTSPPEPDSAKGTEGGGYWRSPACGLQRGPAP